MSFPPGGRGKGALGPITGSCVPDDPGSLLILSAQGTPAQDVDLPPLDVPGCSLVRCVDGRIVEARLYHPTGALDRIAARALGRG